MNQETILAPKAHAKQWNSGWNSGIYFLSQVTACSEKPAHLYMVELQNSITHPGEEKEWVRDGFGELIAEFILIRDSFIKMDGGIRGRVLGREKSINKSKEAGKSTLNAEKYN